MQPARDHVEGAINKLEQRVKHGKIKVKRKRLKPAVLKDSHNKKGKYRIKKSCKIARKKAHSTGADLKREISNEVRNDLLL